MTMGSIARKLWLPLLLIFCYAASYLALQNYHRAIGSNLPPPSLWTLPPLALKILTGEFKGLTADLIVMEAGARLGTRVTRKPGGGLQVVKEEYHWPTIHKLFTNSQALDPAFQQTYILAQGWLSWEAGMVAESNEILRTAARHRPWDWRPLHSVGFNHYFFLNQPGEAGQIMIEASKVPNAPPFLAVLGGRLAKKGGQTAAAIALLRSTLENKTSSEPGYADIADRLQALEGVLILEQAVARYRETTGEQPADLSTLVSAGILPALPENPYNLPYCLDQQGMIHFDNPDCR